MSSPFGMTVKDISNNLFPVVLTIALLVGITFVNIVPTSYRLFADSLPGRLIIVAVIVSTYQIAGWPSTIVAAVLGLLILAGGPRIQGIIETFTSKNTEGFITINEDKPNKKVMWYDEEILGREKKTRTEEVDTAALS